MIFCKSKSNSRLGKALALSVVGVVFLLAFGYSLYNQYFADTISGYLPQETLGYIRFSLPKIKNQPQFRQLLSQVVSQALSDEGSQFVFDESLVKREAAIVFLGFEGRIEPAVIVRTDRPQKTEKLFQTGGLAYKFLDSQRLVAAIDPAVLDFFIVGQDKTANNAITDKFSPFASLAIFISGQLANYGIEDLGWNIISSTLDTADIFAQGKINHGVLEISLLGSTDANRSSDFSAVEADFALAVSDWPQLAAEFSRQLSAKSWSLAGGDWQWVNQRYFSSADQAIWGQAISWAAKANGQMTGWPLADFDFCLKVYFDSADSANQALGSWQEAIKRLLAEKFFSPQTVWLSDGTKVVEYQPLFSRLSYGQQDAFQTISATSSDAKIDIFYAIFDDNLQISNNLSADCAAFDGQNDYLLWDLSLAPFSPPFDFLNAFSQAQISGGKLILR